jgi:hypothetical protein
MCVLCEYIYWYMLPYVLFYTLIDKMLRSLKDEPRITAI